MKKNIIKPIILAICGVLGLSSTPTFAIDICSIPDLAPEIYEANGCNDTIGKDSFSRVVINIINAVIGVLGLVAVIYIVYGGVQYMTSAGDSGKLTKAKSTILYACIGLIICVLAFAIVNFVVTKIIGLT